MSEETRAEADSASLTALQALQDHCRTVRMCVSSLRERATELENLGLMPPLVEEMRLMASLLETSANKMQDADTAATKAKIGHQESFVGEMIIGLTKQAAGDDN